MSTAALRILLVEDNKINQMVAMAMLSARGYEVDVAENGNEAIEAIKGSDYDIVLMDIQMPVMNGVDATKQIRAMGGRKSTVPIIAVTANAMRGDRESYLEAGLDDYLAKPIDTTSLFEIVERWADKTRPDDDSDSPQAATG